jgi:hypothetical protein
MDKFLDALDLPKLNQEDTDHLNRTITSNAIETVVNSLTTKKKPRAWWNHSKNSIRPLKKNKHQ